VDIAIKALVPESLHDESIVISSEEFCHYLNWRERTRQVRGIEQGIDDLPPSLLYPPSPTSSASDTLSNGDEGGLGVMAAAHEENNDGD